MKNKKPGRGLRLTILTAIALTAFAGNSILCRLALGGELITADFFTIVRVLSGAITLWVFSLVGEKEGASKASGSWLGAGLLATYMVSFSWAYLKLQTGTGALLLFGAVQVTMIGWARIRGESLLAKEALGLLLALGGLAWLLLVPGGPAPPLAAGGLMILAGMAWGGYTLAGKGSTNPRQETAGNFAKTIPLLLPLAIWTWSAQTASSQGILLALASGIVTSAAGYTIWYEVVRQMSATRAAGLQLLVPVLASLGGLVIGGEALTSRLICASLLVLGGVALVLSNRSAER